MTRIAIVDKELCRPKKCSYLCQRVCPKNRAKEECIITGEDKKPIIDENICIGCGICSNKCPFKAVKVVNLPEQLEKTPVHRFGRNQFVLFKLPFPVEGKVVGLVGPNGVGKTTALEILSGQIKPNLGGMEADYSELIKMFRGTELQNYLEKLEEKDVKVSYKLQRVDKVPNVYDGKVSKLLDKTDDRNILPELIDRFGLKEILDRTIDEVSGGELQRIAIVASLAKDADIYYFDEPTSFLDVFQRLEVSKLIREFCKDKAVMVVDHDLATLDFLADAIHIFYGYPAAYGIVSSPFSVRVGINTFLDGYIREENIRIRKEPIEFHLSFVEKESLLQTVIGFDNIKKRLGGFTLTVASGQVHQNEVLGILGANALGKTSFAKILAGEIEPDSGHVRGKVDISYKAQYPKSDFEGTVRELLKTIRRDIASSDFKAEVLRPLGLEKLLEKQVTSLSGGELQRTAIATALSRDADVYLLDEPSAYLDVEQRLTLAKMMRRIVEKKDCSAMIIDHDLLFLSQIAGRAMVFLGEPGKAGEAIQPTGVSKSFNVFLNKVGVTFRKDPQTGRPRANKFDSKMDREQKEAGKYFII